MVPARRPGAGRSLTRLVRARTRVSGPGGVHDPTDASVITARKRPEMAGPPPKVPAAPACRLTRVIASPAAIIPATLTTGHPNRPATRAVAGFGSAAGPKLTAAAAMAFRAAPAAPQPAATAL